MVLPIAFSVTASPFFCQNFLDGINKIPFHALILNVFIAHGQSDNEIHSLYSTYIY